MCFRKYFNIENIFIKISAKALKSNPKSGVYLVNFLANYVECFGLTQSKTIKNTAKTLLCRIWAYTCSLYTTLKFLLLIAFYFSSPVFFFFQFSLSLACLIPFIGFFFFSSRKKCCRMSLQQIKQSAIKYVIIAQCSYYSLYKIVAFAYLRVTTFFPS